MRTIILLALVLSLVIPVSGAELSPPEVPESGRMFMPSATENFAAGLYQVIRDGLRAIAPDIREGSQLCIALFAIILLESIMALLPGTAAHTGELTTAAGISVLLLRPSGVMIRLASTTVTEICEYGKLLLPVMTAAMASQGAVTSSAAICAVTVMFSTFLNSLIVNILIPMTYFYLALAIASGFAGHDMLKRIRDGLKWIQTWCMKIVLYTFTGVVGITGVVSGTADAAALKVAKIGISNAVPVVGTILSDASEAVLTGAQIVKNAAGIYGMFAVAAVWVYPFFKIGLQYVILKGIAALCQIIGGKKGVDLITDFSTAMGFLLGMTGSVSIMVLISTVCFMKGIG